MRVANLGVVVVGCGLIFGACAAEVDGVEEVGEESSEIAAAPARYLVVFKTATAPADAGTRITKAGGKSSRTLAKVGVSSFVGTPAAAAKLALDPAVLSVNREHSYKVPATRTQLAPSSIGSPTAVDEAYFLQWDIRRIGAPAVWARTQGGARPRVAVLDTGVMTDHPDLAGQICGEKAFTYCQMGAAPSVAYPAYDQLIDFTGPTPPTGCSDAPRSFQAHGTHVSGTVAGKFGGGAIVGVAPNACVAAYKVFDRFRDFIRDADGNIVGTFEDYSAWDEPLFAAIIDAADAGIPVISMSLGASFDIRDGKATWEAWKRVVTYANARGSLIVAAQGNSELDLTGTLVNIPSDLPHVLAVSATGTSQLDVDTAGNLVAAPGSDVLAFYSNYGKPVDLAAPGGDCGPLFPQECFAEHLILSSYIFDGSEFPGAEPGVPGYSFFAGTSMATPHVAAVAAQVRALHPNWSAQATRAHLSNTATVIGPTAYFGKGLLNADLAVR